MDRHNARRARRETKRSRVRACSVARDRQSRRAVPVGLEQRQRSVVGHRVTGKVVHLR